MLVRARGPGCVAGDAAPVAQRLAGSAATGPVIEGAASVEQRRDAGAVGGRAVFPQLPRGVRTGPTHAAIAGELESLHSGVEVSLEHEQRVVIAAVEVLRAAPQLHQRFDLRTQRGVCLGAFDQVLAGVDVSALARAFDGVPPFASAEEHQQ